MRIFFSLGFFFFFFTTSTFLAQIKRTRGRAPSPPPPHPPELKKNRIPLDLQKEQEKKKKWIKTKKINSPPLFFCSLCLSTRPTRLPLSNPLPLSLFSVSLSVSLSLSLSLSPSQPTTTDKNYLQQHRQRLLHKPLEGLEPLRAHRAVDHPVVARERRRQHRRGLKAVVARL